MTSNADRQLWIVADSASMTGADLLAALGRLTPEELAFPVVLGESNTFFGSNPLTEVSVFDSEIHLETR